MADRTHSSGAPPSDLRILPYSVHNSTLTDRIASLNFSYEAGPAWHEGTLRSRRHGPARQAQSAEGGFGHVGIRKDGMMATTQENRHKILESERKTSTSEVDNGPTHLSQVAMVPETEDEAKDTHCD
ncbi:hypothetical protein NDU88_006826 [Pleurodeles waltl]|uniref:Uncharacterized protein n=1 Tax=Pleurodeles waltl TaxID=8319 RepID=A0AAV7VQ82_PLEWA|nr:hypothetical protein NDU88_006826 [Pleurodeles waltl]